MILQRHIRQSRDSQSEIQTLLSGDRRHSSNTMSKTQLNNIALKVSPCLTPRWTETFELPLIEAIWFVYTRNNNVRYTSGSHLERNVRINAGCSMVSKTLRISILSIHNDNLNYWWCSIATSAQNNACSLRMSGVNPCWSDCRSNKWLEIRLYTNLENIL